MAVYVLTWNPALWDMSDDELAKAIATTSRGARYSEPWSTGGRRSGIVRGDVAVLLRQNIDRGIVALGRFASEVYQDEHWDGSDRDANYADVDWETWLDAADRLPVEELRQRVPGVAWGRMQGSGVRVPDDDAALLLSVWEEHLEHLGVGPIRHADDVPLTGSFREGATTQVLVNRYERDRRAVEAAKRHWGITCVVCDVDFEKFYGNIGEGFIHVHHLRPLASIGESYDVDPINDLRPVCPNCHAMLHRGAEPLTPEQLRAQLRR